ncbi:MAG: helix-turn-helix transcriptional regulator [Acidobacteriota bacterium]
MATWREAFREARDRAGTLDQVAERSGVNRATIHKIESSDTYEPGIETLRKIIELGCNLHMAVFFLRVDRIPIPGEESGSGEGSGEEGLAGSLRGTIDALSGDQGSWQGDVAQAISALNRALGRSTHTADADKATGTAGSGSTSNR